MIEEFELSSCRGKAGLTRRLAETVVKRSRWRKGRPMRDAYRCKICKQWHVGRITRSIPRPQWRDRDDMELQA